MAFKQVLCDECISAIAENLSMDQILILKYLQKENTINMNLSKDKTAIIPEIKGMTDFKFQFSMTGLELCNFVKRNSTKRPNRFFITKDGRKALEIYQNNVKEALEEDE
jgi:hypothetical protein